MFFCLHTAKEYGHHTWKVLYVTYQTTKYTAKFRVACTHYDLRKHFFQFAAAIKEFGAVTHLSFSHASPFYYTVTSGTKVWHALFY